MATSCKPSVGGPGPGPQATAPMETAGQQACRDRVAQPRQGTLCGRAPLNLAVSDWMGDGRGECCGNGGKVWVGATNQRPPAPFAPPTQRGATTLSLGRERIQCLGPLRRRHVEGDRRLVWWS